MCSVGDDVEDQEHSKFMQDRPKFNLTEKKCMKCRTEQPKVVLHNKYPYCQSCFIAATVHKFKALLGKNRVMRPDDMVLVRHQTGHPSTALLHFLRTGLDLTTPKRIRFKPIVIFIEKNYNLPLPERTAILEKIDQEVKRFNFPLYFVSLTQYICKEGDFSSLFVQDFQQIKISKDDATTLKNITKKKANQTVQQEFLKLHERDLLIRAAEFLKCKCVFTPEVGIDIASQLLTSISLGRGANTAFDMGTIDSRDANVAVIRPLRNFHIKELAFYNVFHDLEPVSFNGVKTNPYSSVQSLMQKFVSDLQVNYPATVSTVVRTGDKLCVDKNLEQNEKCPLCKVSLENGCTTLGSAEATNFSHWASTQSRGTDVPLQEHTVQLLENFERNRDLKHCFACSRIVNFS